MIPIEVHLPRDDESGASLLTELCKKMGGNAEWNNSGKGNNFSTLACYLPTTATAVVFFKELLSRGFLFEAWKS